MKNEIFQILRMKIPKMKKRIFQILRMEESIWLKRVNTMYEQIYQTIA